MFLTPLRSAVVRSFALVALLTLACHVAEAKVKPFKVTGSGPAPKGLSIAGVPSAHSAAGNATYLGKYSSDTGVAKVLTFDPTTMSGTFKGSFVFENTKGDALACTYGDTCNGAARDGEYLVVDVGGGNVVVLFLAEFNPVPELCTGRFADVVDGSFLMLAVTEPFPLLLGEFGFTPPFDYSWAGAGWLEFRK